MGALIFYAWASIVHNRFGYVFDLNSCSPVVARQIYEVDPEFEFGFLYFGATDNFEPLLSRAR